MAVELRSALVSDARAIAQLTTQLGYDLDEEETAARLSRVLLRPNQQLLVAEVDGRVVGWIHAVVNDYVDVEAYVSIASAPARRGRARTASTRALATRISRPSTRSSSR